MNKLPNIIQSALSEGSVEVVLAPGEEPRHRREGGWQKLTEIVSASETRQFALQVCTEESKKTLLERGSASGFWDLHQQKLYYEVINTKAGFLVELQWVPEEWRGKDFWNFPKWVNESVTKGAGITVMVAPSANILDSAVESLLVPLLENESAWIAWIQEGSHSQIKSSRTLVTYMNEVPNLCDVVVLQGFENVGKAVTESEKGRRVILILRHHQLVQSMSRLKSLDPSEQFLSHFKMAMSLRVVYGSTGWASFFDLLVNTPQVSAVLQNKDLSGLEKLMRESDKDSGMRTINQSLINLIIRRKIDLKKGFELSPAPSELDSMLKQIGI